MDLSPREAIFLQHLLKETQYRPLSYYAQKMNVTVRTLRTDLRNLEQYFKGLNIRLERKSGLGIYLNDDAREKAALHSCLSSGRGPGSYMTPKGRRLEILSRLLNKTTERLSVQKLSEQYYVSPTSIVNDLKHIERWLNVHDLVLLRDSAGTRIMGSEMRIRRAIASFIEENGFDRRDQMEAFDARKMDRMTMEHLRHLFSEPDIHFLESLLNALERQSGYVIGEPYYLNLLTHLLILAKRVSEGYRIGRLPWEGKEDWSHTAAYAHAAEIAKGMEAHFAIRLEAEETGYIYSYLVSFGIGGSSILETKEGQAGKRLADEIMRWVGRAMAVDFCSDSNLKNEFQISVCSMLCRMQYGIRLKNNLLPGIRQMYPELLAYLDGVIWCLSQSYGFDMVSQDETAAVSMYCQAAAAAAQKPLKVLIVCQSGYGTSQVLRTRLASAFPDLYVAGVASVRNLRELNLSEYSFLVSTVRLQALPVPYVEISPLLSEQDMEKIKKSGLLMEKERGMSGEKDAEEDFLSGELEIAEEKGGWERWMENISKLNPQGKHGLSGGFLEAVLVWGLDFPSKTFVFAGEGGQGKKAVIQGPDPGSLLPLLAGYYRMAGTGYDFGNVNSGSQEQEFLRRILPVSRIITGRHFKTKEEVIWGLAELLFRQGAISDGEAFCRDVFAREMEGLTVIEDNVALPHGQASAASWAMALLPEPVSWGECEGRRIWVRIVVLFAINPKDAYNRNSDYFKSLSIISKATDSPEKRRVLLEAGDPEAALEIVTRSLRGEEEER